MSDRKLIFSNDRLELEIGLTNHINPFRLRDIKENITYADADYSYSLGIRKNRDHQALDAASGESIAGGEIVHSLGLHYSGHQVNQDDYLGTEIQLEGYLEFEGNYTSDIWLTHVFKIPTGESSFIEEEITILNKGTHTYEVSDISFGFRKKIFLRDQNQWANSFQDYDLVAVPHRRRFGHRFDRKLSHYTITDLVPAIWEKTGEGTAENLPDHASEGWVWTDSVRGMLILKYSPDKIEFSVFKGEIMDGNVCVRYGGVGLWRDDPEFAQKLYPNSQMKFGVSRYELIEGDWMAGYYAFRSYMVSQGHTFSDDYDPPVHWNELFNLSWNLGGKASRYTLDQLYGEAKIASEIGCKSLYLDPGWDTVEGSSIWDEKYLGISLKDFVKELKSRFGLEVSLHTIVHPNSTDEYPGMYKKNQNGELIPYWQKGALICTQSDWKQEQSRRLIQLARDGVVFIMFDFIQYREPCFDTSHEHEIPSTRQDHADGILEVIGNLKKAYPNLYVESHDRITTGLQDYHPLYYQHKPPNSFDENWGFEYMWDSYLDLLSGKAFSLYEYNLAYEIPLYLHINIGQNEGLLTDQPSARPVGPDSSNMLGFWWYASTVRHLGIGGVNSSKHNLYGPLRESMNEYMVLRDFFVRGTFYGVDEFTHVHVLAELNQAVINIFNLRSEPINREVIINIDDIGLNDVKSITGSDMYNVKKRQLSFQISINPLSPSIVKVNF